MERKVRVNIINDTINLEEKYPLLVKMIDLGIQILYRKYAVTSNIIAKTDILNKGEELLDASASFGVSNVISITFLLILVPHSVYILKSIMVTNTVMTISIVVYMLRAFLGKFTFGTNQQTMPVRNGITQK
ncbi:hypothetical protein [Pseudopedobacter beijingensis]|uniref:Uncharacterized protein n=1 Tax=Pseudopedobacter beijingensis TaxID=1207056 RepID=A0ABW4ID18_9SPHI